MFAQSAERVVCGGLVADQEGEKQLERDDAEDFADETETHVVGKGVVR